MADCARLSASRDFFLASHLVVGDARGSCWSFAVIDLEVGEQRAASCCNTRSTAIAIRRISSSAPSPQRSSSIVRQARALPETTIFTSVAFGSTLRAASRASLRRCTLSRDPSVALHQSLDGAHVRRLRLRDLPLPLGLELRIALRSPEA